ncbi:DNA primase (bacterial type) (DnaG) [uncultured Mediterranean phage uvMED]|nr:DNA primase (bacterial type) (DnaG) [uncultured Mediterranean phage uvMED]
MNYNEFINIGITPKGDAIEQKVICPQCSHTRKNKKDPCLSINLDKGVYNCHNCGWSGNVNFKPKKEFVKPPEAKTNLSEKTIKWFNKRGITEATLAHWKIGESIEYFPQARKERNAINFNYFREGELINCKYRDGQKNFKMVSGAELIFYGLDSINEMPTIYIVEGEMDALSLHEAGIYSVCSVPNGASKGNQRLDYLDNCWEYFKDKKEIILCTDNDQPGLSLRNELARRFGQYRCKYVEFGDFKDANEVLIEKGAEVLRNILKTSKHFPLEGVVNVNDIWKDVLNYNENGIKNYSVGLGNSDDYFKIDFEGSWSVVTGIPNSGKSDVVDQIACNMAVNYRHRTAFFAPESFPYEGHIKRLANKLNERICTNEDLNNTKDFIEEHFYFVKIDLDNLTLDGILEAFRDLVFQKGVNLLVIDPWNMLDHSAQRDHSYIGVMLSKITQFCQQSKTHLFLVAHPRKMSISESGIYQVPTPYDISGSSDFFNKAFNCVTVYRSLGEITKYKSDAVQMHIQKVKRKENGSQGMFTVAPDFKDGGVYKSIDEKKQRFTVVHDQVPF